MKKSYSFMTTLLVSLAVAFSACEKEPKYIVQVRANEGGIIEGQSGYYVESKTIAFQAIPNDGYFFAGWSDGNTDNPREITVGSDNIYLLASFATTVDLGLTSGTLWATNNLGAYTPGDDGNYYAWGETTTKIEYNWDDYIYGSDYHALTKYCNKADYGKSGFTDNLTSLEDADNAVIANIGNNWSMPTATDFQELYDQCYWFFTEKYYYNNCRGWGFIIYKSVDKSKDKQIYKESDHKYSPETDIHIFLPVTGYYSNSEKLSVGSAYYWTTTLNTERPNNAQSFDTNGSMVLNWGKSRCVGMPIRPIRRK